MKKSALGFTLVELLVVVTIMAITGVFAFANFANFGEDQKLKSATADIQSLIRQAQANASSNTKCQDNFSAKWQVVFSADRKTVTLGCEESGTFYSKKILALDKVDQNLQIESISRAGTACPADPGLPYTINFELLKGTMNLGEPQCTSFIVSLQNATNSKSLSMTTGGVLQTRPSCDADGSQLNGLVGYWDFDEGSGTTVADKSGYNHNLVLPEVNWVNLGKIQHAYNFNGANQAIYTSGGFLPSGGSARTITFWFKPNTGMVDTNIALGYGCTDTEGYGHCSNAGVGRYVGAWANTSNIGMHLETCGINGPSTPSPVTGWHFYTAVFDGGGHIILYVDGSNPTTTTPSCTIDTNSGKGLSVGSGPWGYYHGFIDEVRIYNRALTSAEITNSYNGNAGCSLF